MIYLSASEMLIWRSLGCYIHTPKPHRKNWIGRELRRSWCCPACKALSCHSLWSNVAVYRICSITGKHDLIIIIISQPGVELGLGPSSIFTWCCSACNALSWAITLWSNVIGFNSIIICEHLSTLSEKKTYTLIHNAYLIFVISFTQTGFSETKGLGSECKARDP